MSVEIRSLNDGRGLLYFYRGEVCYEDDQRANKLLWDTHDMSMVRFSIIDHLNATENLMTTVEVEMVAKYCIDLSQRMHRHIVPIRR